MKPAFTIIGPILPYAALSAQLSLLIPAQITERAKPSEYIAVKF